MRLLETLDNMARALGELGTMWLLDLGHEAGKREAPNGAFDEALIANSSRSKIGPIPGKNVGVCRWAGCLTR